MYNAQRRFILKEQARMIQLVKDGGAAPAPRASGAAGNQFDWVTFGTILQGQIEDGIEEGFASDAAFEGTPLDTSAVEYQKQRLPKVAEYMAELRQKFVGGAGEAMAKRINAAVVDALNDGKGVKGAIDGIREANKINLSRARTIARTESNIALTGGAEIRAEQQSMKYKKWITEGDDAVRKDHVAAAREGWIWATEEFESTGTMRPGTGPAGQVVNCRCNARYSSRPKNKPKGQKPDSKVTATAPVKEQPPETPEEYYNKSVSATEKKRQAFIEKAQADKQISRMSSEIFSLKQRREELRVKFDKAKYSELDDIREELNSASYELESLVRARRSRRAELFTREFGNDDNAPINRETSETMDVLRSTARDSFAPREDFYRKVVDPRLRNTKQFVTTNLATDSERDFLTNNGVEYDLDKWFVGERGGSTTDANGLVINRVVGSRTFRAATSGNRDADSVSSQEWIASTTMHEAAHSIEYSNPKMGAVARAWVEEQQAKTFGRNSNGSLVVKSEQLGEGFKSDEFYFRDSSHKLTGIVGRETGAKYIFKDYSKRKYVRRVNVDGEVSAVSDTSTEFWTMLTEALYNDPVRFADEQPELFNMVTTFLTNPPEEVLGLNNAADFDPTPYINARVK